MISSAAKEITAGKLTFKNSLPLKTGITMEEVIYWWRIEWELRLN